MWYGGTFIVIPPPVIGPRSLHTWQPRARHAQCGVEIGGRIMLEGFTTTTGLFGSGSV